MLDSRTPISWVIIRQGDLYERGADLVHGDTIANERIMFQWNFEPMENIAKEFEKYEPKEAGVTGIFCDTNVNWNQPQWLLESPPDEPLKYEREDRLSGEDDCDNSEPTWSRRDLLAWYVPAHTGRDDYGIHFDASAVRTLGNTLKSLAVTSSISDREWLIAAIEVCFWHEVCHAWVEDLVSLSESITGGRYYQNAQKKYGNYIYMEEALCNTSVTGMLKMFFQSNNQKQMIFNAVGEFMKKQPQGYRNYIDLKWWSANQSIFLTGPRHLTPQVSEWLRF